MMDAGVYSAALSIYEELQTDPTSAAGTARLGMARIWMDWGQLELFESAIGGMPRSQAAWDVVRTSLQSDTVAGPVNGREHR